MERSATRTGRDRSFLEYPSIDMDSKGAAVVVYNDNTNQSEGPYVMTAKQATGPSLLASVGLLGGETGHSFNHSAGC